VGFPAWLSPAPPLLIPLPSPLLPPLPLLACAHQSCCPWAARQVLSFLLSFSPHPPNHPLTSSRAVALSVTAFADPLLHFLIIPSQTTSPSWVPLRLPPPFAADPMTFPCHFVVLEFRHVCPPPRRITPPSQGHHPGPTSAVSNPTSTLTFLRRPTLFSILSGAKHNRPCFHLNPSGLV